MICVKSECVDIMCIKDEQRRQSMLQTLNHCFNPFCQIPTSQVPEGLKKCTRCSLARYCSRACQIKHWKIHKGLFSTDLQLDQKTANLWTINLSTYMIVFYLHCKFSARHLTIVLAYNVLRGLPPMFA